MIRSLLAIGTLTLTYALVLGSFDLWDLALGIAIATGLRLAFRRRLRDARVYSPIRLSQMIAFWPFAGAVLWEILAGAWVMVRAVLHIDPLRKSGIVAIPIEDRTPAAVVVSALAINLSPGTVVVDVDTTRQVMFVHVFDASDPERLRARYHEFYVRFQRPVFP